MTHDARHASAPRRRAVRLGTLILLWTCVALGTPPTPPYTIDLDDRAIAAALAADGSLELPLVVLRNAPALDVVVQVYLRPLQPGQPDHLQPKATLTQELRVDGKRRERKLGVRLPGLKPGEYVLEARISGRTSADSGFSDRAIRYLTIDARGQVRVTRPEERQRAHDDARRRAFQEALARDSENPRIRMLMEDSFALPRDVPIRPGPVAEDRQMLVRHAGPSADLKGYYVEREADAWSPDDPLTVRGRVVFQDSDGQFKPLVNVSVHVWDEDTFGDEHLGGVATGWDGRWSLSVNNDDGTFQDGRDIYYTFQLFNTRLDLSRCDGDYRWKSAVREDLDDGTVVDFGNETASTSTDALVVWDRLNISWNHVSTAGGRDPGLINACYPTAKTNYTTTVNIATNRFDGDSVPHEYGHALMDKAYSEDVSPGGAHGFDDCNQNQGLSWSEGFATGFMLSAFPDGRYNWAFGDMGRQLETFSSSCHLGETSEGWVGAALNDFVDANGDTNGTDDDRGRDGHADDNAAARVPLASIYRDTMWGSVHFDVLDFWYDLSGSLDAGRREGAAEIMYYDWMSVLPPDSCVATKAATANEADAQSLLADLRRFRDLALKPQNDGRELINLYYRNSPELAALLLRDAGATADALRVIRHFAGLGATIGTHRRYLAAMAADAEVFPGDVRDAIERLFAFFGRQGGASLQRDLKQASAVYANLAAMHLPELQRHLAERKAAQANQPRVRLAPGNFSPESERALERPDVRRLRERGL